MPVYTTERRKTEREREKENVSPSPAALQHREKKFCVRKKNFKIFIMPQWIFWEDNISFLYTWRRLLMLPKFGLKEKIDQLLSDGVISKTHRVRETIVRTWSWV